VKTEQIGLNDDELTNQNDHVSNKVSETRKERSRVSLQLYTSLYIHTKVDTTQWFSNHINNRNTTPRVLITYIAS